MSVTQSQCFVELSSFSDLARYVCAFREYPLRAYSHTFNKTSIISSTLALANTLLIFYVPTTLTGRYISYRADAGREYCDIVESTKDISSYAPIINFESEISPLKTKSSDTADVFNPILIRDIGSLARLSYDPEFPHEQKLALLSFKHKESWVMGYVTSLEMDEIIYQFNYVKLESEPTEPFVKYQGSKGKDPEFTATFEHGFSYLPIIKIKQAHPIFGMD